MIFQNFLNSKIRNVETTCNFGDIHLPLTTYILPDYNFKFPDYVTVQLQTQGTSLTTDLENEATDLARSPFNIIDFHHFEVFLTVLLR